MDGRLMWLGRRRSSIFSRVRSHETTLHILGFLAGRYSTCMCECPLVCQPLSVRHLKHILQDRYRTLHSSMHTRCLANVFVRLTIRNCFITVVISETAPRRRCPGKEDSLSFFSAPTCTPHMIVPHAGPVQIRVDLLHGQGATFAQPHLHAGTCMQSQSYVNRGFSSNWRRRGGRCPCVCATEDVNGAFRNAKANDGGTENLCPQQTGFC
jgi:hypothetical protein